MVPPPHPGPFKLKMSESLIVSPGPDGRSVRNAQNEVLQVPEGWVLLPPGDPALTRRVKEAGPSWQVRYRRGNKIFSAGVWAPQATIDRIARDLKSERSTPDYARKRAADTARRERDHRQYVEDFYQATLAWLNFAPKYLPIADRLARAVTKHATPVGSGTVARTERIPLADRAAAAVIAWMRHQTTRYDHMTIERVKGARRAVRRDLAQSSKEILNDYRSGAEIDPETCPLWLALVREGL